MTIANGDSEPVKRIKLTCHPEKGKWVVNMPGTGMRPRVYRSLDKALAKIAELAD